MSKTEKACELIRSLHFDVYSGDRPSGDTLWKLEVILHDLCGIRVPTEAEIENGTYDENPSSPCSICGGCGFHREHCRRPYHSPPAAWETEQEE